MALFISVYESFEDYILGCPKNYYDDGLSIRKDSKDYKERHDAEIARQMQVKESAKQSILLAQKEGREILENDDVYIYANFDFQKNSTEGVTNWLSPKYEALINKRLLTINGKKQTSPNVLLNSLMFFKCVTEDDIEAFLKMKKTRNMFAHQMADLLVTNVTQDNAALFNDLINLYMKVNNWWAVEFECKIAKNIPEKADYENIITVKMFNLLSAIDALTKSNFLLGRDYCCFTGLYEGLMIPLKEDTTLA
jgi:hypothetical protein